MSSEVVAQAPAGQPQEGDGGGGEQQAPQPRRSGWGILKSILFQMVIFYVITSFFRGRRQQPVQPPDGSGLVPGVNLFTKGQEMVQELMY